MALDNEVTSTLVYPPLSNYVDSSYLNGNNYYFSIPKLTVPKLTTPRLTTPRLTVPRLRVPIKPSQFKRPERRHVKDLGDILFGNPLTGTRQLQETLEDNNLEGLKYVPILNRVVGLFLGAKERELDPILEGDFKEAGINFLESTGDTLDTFANPIKALLPTTGGGTYDDFLKSMGWLDGEYRERYQWDTGNFIVDLAGEIISDPANWFTLGGKEFAKQSIDDVVHATRKTLERNLGKDVADGLSDIFIRNLVVDLENKVLRNSDEIIEELTKTLRINRHSFYKDFKAMSIETAKSAETKALLRQYTYATTPTQLNKLADEIRALKYNRSYKQAAAAFKLQHIGKSMDDALIKSALLMSPTATLSYTAYKRLSPKIKTLLNSARMDLKEVSLEKDITKRTEAFQNTANKIVQKSYYLNREVITKWEEMLAKYSLNYKQIQYMYNQVIQSIPYNKRTVEEVNNRFLKKLEQLIPEIKSIRQDVVPELDKTANNVLKIKPNYFTKTDVDDFLDVLSEAGVTIEYAKRMDIQNYKTIIKEQAKVNPDLIYRYIRELDEEYLPKRGISGIKSLNKDALKRLTKEERAQLNDALKVLGITDSNKMRVSKLLEEIRRTDDSVKVSELIDLVTDTRIDEVVTPTKVANPFKHDNIESIAKSIEDNLPQINEGLTELTEDATRREIKTFYENYEQIINNITEFNMNYNAQYMEEMYAYFMKNDMLSDNTATRDAFENFFEDFNKLTEEVNKVDDIHKLDVNTVRDFLTSMDELSVRINIYHARYLAGELPDASLEIGKFLNDSKNLLQFKELKKYLNNYLDTYNALEQLYILQLSQQGQFHYIFSGSLGLLDEKFRNDLIDPDSDLRKLLNEVTYKFRTTNPTLAGYFDNILGSVDSTMKLYDTVYKQSLSILPAYETNNELKKFVQGEIFNRIHNTYRGYNSKQIIDLTSVNIEQLTDEFMTNFQRHAQSKITLGEGLETYSDYLKYVHDNVYEVLSDYKDYMRELSVKYGMDHIKFGMYFNNTTVGNMSALSDSFVEIMQALEDGNVSSENIIEIQNFILNISGRILNAEKKEALDYLNKYYLSAESIYKEALSTKTKGPLKDDFILEFVNNKLNNDSLARNITNSFIDVEKMNNLLARYEGDLGKLYGKKIKSYLGYRAYSLVTDYIKNFTEWDNIYAWSTANGVLNWKKDIDFKFISEHGITTNNLRIMDSAEMRMFQVRFENAYKYTEHYVRYNKQYLEDIRTALIDTFRDASIAYGPKDPATFFAHASLQDIATWDLIVRESGFDFETTNRYVNKVKEIHGFTPRSVQDVVDMTNQINKGTCFEEDAWNQFVRDTPTTNKEKLFDVVAQDLTTYIKDPKSLNKYKGIIDEYIQKDVTLLDKLKENVTEIDKLEGKIGQYKSNKVSWSTLNSYGIYKNTNANDYTVKKFLKTEREAAIAESIRSYSAKELRSFIDYETKEGFAIFYNSKAEVPFLFSKEELTEAGLKIETLKDNPNVFLIKRTDSELRPCCHAFKQLDSALPQLQEQYNKLILDNDVYYELGSSVLPHQLFTGTIESDDIYEAIIKDPRLKKFLEPEQKVYSKTLEKESSKTAGKNISNFTLTLVGDPGAYNNITNVFLDTLEREDIKYTTTSEALNKSLLTGSITAIKRANNKTKYMQLILNEDFSLDNPLFRQMFSGASDAEIKEIFKRNNFDACILRENKQGKPRLYKIYIENRQQLEQAIKANATILPHEIYRNAMLTINKEVPTSKLLNFYTKTIVGTYKTLYLNTFGWLFRNGLDSLFYKNMATTEGLSGFADTLKYNYKGMQLYRWYDEIVGNVIAENNTYSRKLIEKRISTLSKTDQDLFKLIDSFMWSAGNGGLTESLETFLKDYYTKDHVNEFAVASWWNQNVIGENNPVAHFFNKSNETIEKSARLGLFLNLVDNGLDPTDAIRKVIDTHFDYQASNLGLLEQIFWFSTFPINNMYYYLNYGLTKNPEMLKLVMDVEQLSWNSSGMTWDDVKQSNYLTYNALVGNVKFKAFGKNIVLKTGSSVLDFFNILVNPLGESTERLNPFLSVILGLEGANELNALSGVGNRYKQITTGRSYVPSVYATLYDRKEYPKRLYKYENYSGGSSSWHPKPKKPYIKKPDNIKRLAYKFQTYRYYFGKGPNRHRWLSSTTSIEPYWYMKDYRWMRQQRRYYQGVRQINRIR